MGNVKNVMEGVLSYFLDRNLALRFDICTCDRCKAEMLRKLTPVFPPVYVDSDDSRYRTIEKELSRKNLPDIFNAINRVIAEVGDNPPHGAEEDKEKALDDLINKIRDDRGVDFSGYRRSILKRRIALRLTANKVNSYVEYLSVLAKNPHEYEDLFEALTINVSEFFRDPYVWMNIKDLLEEIIGRNSAKNEPTVLWSAGCAHGEEPYSLAIIAREVDNFKTPVKIYATDIDADSLKGAKEGVYDSMNTIRNVLKGYFNFAFDKYFSFRDGRYHVSDSLKDLIEFKYLDLTASSYLENVDMILCRNVFIYFDKALQERSVDRFYRALKPGGYLIVGETETLVPEAGMVFIMVGKNRAIFQAI